MAAAGDKMPSLTINLEEGFRDDTVVLKVNESEVLRRTGVSTDLSAGLAGSVEVQVPEGSIHLQISVPTKSLFRALELQVVADLSVRVSVMDGSLDVQTTSERLYYL